MKTIVITGASSGIGKAFAYEFAKRKINLILIARREELLKELKIDLEEKYQIKVNYFLFDLADLSSLKELLKVLENYEIEMFINNAGYGKVKNFVEMQEETIINMLNLLIISPTYLTNAMSQFFLKKKIAGTIVNLGSIGAVPNYFPKLAVYAAAKRYILQFSQAVNYENKFQQNNIKVITVMPGSIKTEFANHLGEKDVDKSIFNKYASNVNVFAAKVVNQLLGSQKSVIYAGKFSWILRIASKIIPQNMVMNYLYRKNKL